MGACDVQDCADFLDALTLGTKEVCAGIGEGELGSGKSTSADFRF
jgi:hypothetical protein